MLPVHLTPLLQVFRLFSLEKSIPKKYLKFPVCKTVFPFFTFEKYFHFSHLKMYFQFSHLSMHLSLLKKWASIFFFENPVVFFIIFEKVLRFLIICIFWRNKYFHFSCFKKYFHSSLLYFYFSLLKTECFQAGRECISLWVALILLQSSLFNFPFVSPVANICRRKSSKYQF